MTGSGEQSIQGGAPVVKTVRSWSKPEGIPDLIGRKRVDWSVFVDGTAIPLEFHEDFRVANGGRTLARGESHEVHLVVAGKPFVAQLVNENRATPSDTLQIRYDSNAELRELLAQQFHLAYDYLVCERARRKEAGRRLFLTVPAPMAAYMDFIATGVAFRYGVDLTVARTAG